MRVNAETGMLYQLRASGPTDCVDTMLEIRVATKQQLSIMERLIELYLYDLSEFAWEEAGAHLTFEYDSLIRYGRDCVMAASD